MSGCQCERHPRNVGHESGCPVALRENVESLRHDLEATQRQLDEAREEVRIRGIEIISAEEQLDEVTTELAEAREEIERLKAENERLTRERDEWEEAYEKAASAWSAAKAENEKLRYVCTCGVKGCEEHPF